MSVDRSDRKYGKIGLRAKAVREHLRMTLDEMSRDAGISRGYVSDFERGVKLPTGKYLRHLHDKHGVNLNFLYNSEGRMFRPSKEEEIVEFGKYQEDIDELLKYLAKIPHALYSVMGFFAEYKLENAKIVAKYFPDKQG